MLLDKFQMIANCYGGSNVLHMLILHSKCSINVPTSSVRPGTCRNIWNVPNLLLAGKWQVLSTRACNVLKMFSSVSRPPHPQYGMVDPGAEDTDQLPTNVNHLRAGTLIIPTIPLLHAAFYLHRVVGRQRQSLEATVSGDSTRRDEIVQQQRVERPESTTRTLDGLVDGFGRGVDAIWIVASSPCVLDIVLRLETLEPIGVSVVDVLSVGDELGRRRGSVGSRHFEWRMG